MASATSKKRVRDDALIRLVCDLETKTTLRRAKDYPAVTLKQLNEYLVKHGPLVNPSFGEQPAFFLDDGYLTPYRMVVYGREVVAAKIAECLDVWASGSREGGRVTTVQGAFILEQCEDGPKVRMPDVAYTPRATHRGLDDHQQWTYCGEPFAPTFAVEVDKLQGAGSQRRALDRKMRDEFFKHGVQLAWLIDPRPESRLMYEYFVDRTGNVQCSSDSAWRDLGGRDVLPGFRLRSAVLEMVLNQDSASSQDDEEEEDLVCPVAGCGQVFRSMSPLMLHFYVHREDKAVERYVASRASK